MDKQYEIVSQKNLHQGFYRLDSLEIKHTLFSGGWSEKIKRELFRRNDCVGVLLYDPELDKVIILEQFRVGAINRPGHAWLLEIVAGAIEYGETAEEVAYREVKEEAGCEVKDLREIMQFYTTPGGSSERITLYYAEVDSTQIGGIHGLIDEGEEILVSVVPADEVFVMLQNGLIDSATPIIALQWLYLNREQLRRQWFSKNV